MLLQEVGNGRITDGVANLSELTVHLIESPGWIRPRKLHCQVNHHLPNSWSTCLALLALGVIPLLGDQPSLSTHSGSKVDQMFDENASLYRGYVSAEFFEPTPFFGTVGPFQNGGLHAIDESVGQINIHFIDEPRCGINEVLFSFFRKANRKCH